MEPVNTANGFAAGLALVTAALLLMFGRSPWIAAMGAAILAVSAFVALIAWLFLRDVATGGVRRRLLGHRGLLASGALACATSCLLAAALVTRHAENQWGVLYVLLAVLMTAGIVAIRFAYAGTKRVESAPEPS